MKKFLVLLVVLFSAAAAQAQTTVWHRIDSVEGQAPRHSIGVITSQLEVYALGYNKRATQDLEVGRLVPLGKHLLVGGYAAILPESNKLFVLPWVSYRDRIGKTKLGIDLSDYVPLNGGENAFFCNDLFVTQELKKGVDAGLSGWFYWTPGGNRSVRVGPTLRLVKGDASLQLNYQPFTVNGDLPTRLRVIATKTF